jgi:hypothetical protein
MARLTELQCQRISYIRIGNDTQQPTPKVVFEILSARNKTREGMEAMEFKFLFYENTGDPPNQPMTIA